MHTEPYIIRLIYIIKNYDALPVSLSSHKHDINMHELKNYAVHRYNCYLHQYLSPYVSTANWGEYQIYNSCKL
jgi:hypothetical protein